MIIDCLKNAGLYASMQEDFAEVFEVIEKMVRGEICEKVVIREGSVWVNAPKTTVISDAPKKYEAHRNFIDVQFILSGAEQFGCANVERLTPAVPYDTQKDIEFFDGEPELFTLRAGDFCIVYPHDAHLPAYAKLGDGDLVRIVAKIRCK